MTTTTSLGPSVSRGDVVLVLFPNSELLTAKRRPALVFQADNLETGLDQVIAAMLTSRSFRAGHPSRVMIRTESPGGQNSGLLTDSVVMTDNLATVFLQAIERKIGSLPMERIDQALRHTLAL